MMSRSLDLVSTRFRNLPAGIEITPARLTINFVRNQRTFWRSSPLSYSFCRTFC